MSWQIDAVTIPAPARVVDIQPAEVRSYSKTGSLPVLISIGQNKRTLTLTGVFHGASKSAVELTYIKPLREKVGSIVTLSAPDTRYSGQYILEKFEYSEEEAKPVFHYTIHLSQGSVMVRL